MYRAIVILLVLVAGIAMPGTLRAQSKVRASGGIWPEWQVNYGLGESGLVFFQNQFRINTDSHFNDFRESGLLSNFERIQFSLGYEQTFNDHWRAGALWRYAAENNPSASFYGLFLRHNGAVKGLYFNKQLLAEYVHQDNQDAYGQYRLLAELGKRLPVKQHYLTPSISYEAAIVSEFGGEESNAEERFIDRTWLRLGLTYEITSKFTVTPYFLRQTEYYYVEVSPVYDENDVLIKNGYRTKRNIITPVFGLELKYNINRVLSTASISY